MDHTTALRHLVQAESRFSDSMDQVARQRELVQKLESVGDDCRQAKVRLARFEQMLYLSVIDRERALRDMNAIETRSDN